ncbi:hypothetical protein V6Z11_D11G341700 [Gossypium hirsutum]|uniref:non-specific serine/threonine protein kinase n=1 Tax=Gossypium hirsutum TaxID=3635 RepID=A0ABM3B1B7_GOSHI|nr:probable leucine-rich repeat receptor-like serine/threonine-protein kinase At3g14840 isoform X2 [Gossypium hirsutum]
MLIMLLVIAPSTITLSVMSSTLFIVCCLTTLTNGATLPNDEVDALRSTGKILGKTNWNFDIDPCSRGNSWLDQPTRYYANNVTCDCSFNNNTTCHVTHILLTAQSLLGTLPPNLTSLPFLQKIDLTRNYLSGPIPPEWGSTRLVSISLLGNRLTGSIPGELANLRNLTSLILDNNDLFGTLPAALGNLSKIERLHLSSNKFTGEIPEVFGRLTSLKEFRISDNNFTGQIPDFIFQKWTNLEQIYMEGSGLSGPIPSINATLENLEYIIISDLNGAETSFPQLFINVSLPKLDRLMLRSCNLVGEIPASFGTSFTTIHVLDLSFNRLSGKIPEELSALALTNLFLNGNNFTGTVPSWMLNTNVQIDLSYNNFTDTGVSDCQQNSPNLFSSIARVNNTGIVPCLTSLINCTSEPLHFVHINCGGRITTVNDTTYEADYDQAGPSTFYRSTNWAFSSTGIFLSDDRPDDILVLNNGQVSVDGDEEELYTNARLAPSSLTYYAFCLANATYTVNLHFAEIQFTDDQTYSSLGRRIFDVYIQGKQELKDFNIEEEAGGAGIPIVKKFTVNVSDGTLEIHFRWAGKGTTSMPERSIYGPLISAISVLDPGYKPPSKSGGRISTATMAGIVAGATSATLLIVGIFWWNCCYKLDDEVSGVLFGDEFQNGMELRKFSLVQIAKMTNNFNGEKLGKGGFGVVYKGYLRDSDTYVAVKRISKASKQGIKEYASEVKIISQLRHKNLVKLIGQCHEKGELILVYELMANSSLDSYLFKGKTLLTWEVRFKIVQDLASALFYLHEEGDHCVLHRDIKASNIMLDSSFNAKLGDFGLARLVDHEKASQTTHLAGTLGYLAPECVSSGKASKESDVYSFGVVALEIACGRRSIESKYEESQVPLVAWVWDSYGSQRLLDVADPKLSMNFDAKQMECLLMIGLWCVHPDQHFRPSIRQTIQVLNFEAPWPKLPSTRPTATYNAQITSEIQTSEPCFSDMSIMVPR